jgi:hypothetical protein
LVFLAKFFAGLFRNLFFLLSIHDALTFCA